MKYQKSFKEVLERIVKGWYLLVIFALLGVAAAWFYNRNALPTYSVTTTLLYKSTNATQPVFPEKAVPPGKRPSLENQVGIISSYSLVLKTLENLKWNALVAEKGLLSNKDLFDKAPFELRLDSNINRNLLQVPFTVKPVSATDYEISADHEVEKDGVKRKVEFASRGKVGQPFRNEHFQFVLDKKPGTDWKIDQEYIVELADMNLIALDYQKKLDIKLADKESDLIYVSLQSKNASRAVSFLNELVNVYIKFGIEEKNKQAENTIAFIDNQIYGIKDSLQRAGNNLSSYRSATRSVDIGKESGFALEKYQTINLKESELQMRIRYFSSLRQSLNDAGSMKNLAAPSVVGVNDPALNSTIIKLTELASQREVLSHTLQEGNPALESLDKEITFTRSSLAKNLDNLLLNAQMELGTLNQQKSSIGSQLSSLPKEEQNLIGIQRNFDLNNQLYTFLMQKRAEAGIIKASNFADVEVLDPASDATAKVMGHNRLVNLAIGLVLGVIAVMLYFLSQAYMDKRIYNVEQIYQSLQTKVFGVIYQNKLKTALPVLLYPQSSLTESFRSLRTNIHQYFNRNLRHKIISVNSCMPGEGKSFITLNLALILARNSKRVLVIDTDLRKPKLHKLLGRSNDTGLTDYLNGKKSVKEIILSTDNKDLRIISAGPAVAFPSELINNNRLEKLIEEVKEQYDYIILKTAPVGIINDAKTIFPMTDLNLFVVKMISTTDDELDFINATAKDFATCNFGVVINRVKNPLASKEKSFGYYSEKKALEVERELNGVQ